VGIAVAFGWRIEVTHVVNKLLLLNIFVHSLWICWLCVDSASLIC
jgi:hypothetical protein